MAAVLGAQVDASSGIDVGIGSGLILPSVSAAATMATCRLATGEFKLVLNVGNFLESSLPNVRLFFEARKLAPAW
ncbi:MAG: hypothetical protein ACLT98_15365 [Eggerthellaceae bacterium]